MRLLLLLPTSACSIEALLGMQIYSADPLCKGEDWVAINELEDIDIASVHIYTEFWPICTE